MARTLDSLDKIIGRAIGIKKPTSTRSNRSSDYTIIKGINTRLRKTAETLGKDSAEYADLKKMIFYYLGTGVTGDKQVMYNTGYKSDDNDLLRLSGSKKALNYINPNKEKRTELLRELNNQLIDMGSVNTMVREHKEEMENLAKLGFHDYETMPVSDYIRYKNNVKNGKVFDKYGDLIGGLPEDSPEELREAWEEFSRAMTAYDNTKNQASNPHYKVRLSKAMERFSEETERYYSAGGMPKSNANNIKNNVDKSRIIKM